MDFDDATTFSFLGKKKYGKKKKSAAIFEVAPPSPPPPVPGDSVAEDAWSLRFNARPTHSVYDKRCHETPVGSSVYYIHPGIIAPYPRLSSDFGWGKHPHFGDIDPDIGHTLVHFLYTGSYETLKSDDIPSADDKLKECKRAFLSYQAAIAYDLDGLVELARERVKALREFVTIFDLLQMAETVYPKLPEHEEWLAIYLAAEAKAEFKLDKTIFLKECLHAHVGETPRINSVLFTVMAEAHEEEIVAMVEAHEKERAAMTKEFEEKQVSMAKAYEEGRAAMAAAYEEKLTKISANPVAAEPNSANRTSAPCEAEQPSPRSSSEFSVEQSSELESRPTGSIPEHQARQPMPEAATTESPRDIHPTTPVDVFSRWGSHRRSSSASNVQPALVPRPKSDVSVEASPVMVEGQDPWETWGIPDKKKKGKAVELEPEPAPAPGSESGPKLVQPEPKDLDFCEPEPEPEPEVDAWSVWGLTKKKKKETTWKTEPEPEPEAEPGQELGFELDLEYEPSVKTTKKQKKKSRRLEPLPEPEDPVGPELETGLEGPGE
ncbi:hypothetical protein EJ06DRAFT_532776 [Trichodelitschia bisporula]|uniref:BTB domain-containing protein n=1 Tax=Trichodelitschia bisporula TaxID=703511 RepID=A0A6G1HNY8_9PEZI|nr:hypothetical protein EJ06DRAFT_532776 [Trichodelitschia bisporula]